MASDFMHLMRSESFDIICHVMSLIYVNGLRVHLPQFYKGITIILTASFYLQHKRNTARWYNLVYSLQGQDSATDSLDAEYELLEVSKKTHDEATKFSPMKSHEFQITRFRYTNS